MDVQLDPCPNECETLEYLNTESTINNINYLTDPSIKLISDLFDQLSFKLLLQPHDLLSVKLTELRHNSIQLILLSPKYDYSPSNPGNGYRSFVKIITQFISKWIKKFTIYKIKYKELEPCKRDLMINLVTFLITLSNLLILIDSKTSELNVSDLLTIHHSSIDKIILKSLLSIDSATLYNFFHEFNGPFWLTSSLDLSLKIYSRLVTFYSSTNDNIESNINTVNIFKMLLNINDEVMKANVKFTLSGTVNQVKKLWSFYGQKVNYPLIMMSNSFKIPKIRKFTTIKRNYVFKIDKNKIIFNQFTSKSSSSSSSTCKCNVNYSHNCNDNCNCSFGTDCKLNCQNSNLTSQKESSNEIGMLILHDNYFGKSPNDTVVLHLHGGGFVSIKPKCHEIYLRKWSSNLNGVPIVSIDYSLSPQVKYPTALEEILEVYLYLIDFDVTIYANELTSLIGKNVKLNEKKFSQKKVQDLLGFIPKNIVLFGDSAGSNLSLSLMHILYDLNNLLCNNLTSKSNNNNLVPYPKALFLPYPHANPTLRQFTPSRLLLTIDPILPFGSLYSLSEAYTPDEKDTLDKNNNYLQVNSCFNCSTNLKCNSKNNNNGNNENIVTNSNEKSNKLHSSKCKKMDKKILNGNNNNNNNKPWYKLPEVCSFRLEQMDQLNLGKYFNPLISPLDDFNSIPLYIQVGEFDPLLDESIAIANKWKGNF